MVGSPFGNASFTKQSVPTADQEPGSAWNDTRIAAFEPPLKLKRMLAYFDHVSACCFTFAFWVELPSRNATLSTLPVCHFLPAKSAIFAGWADAPGMRAGILGRFLGFSANAASAATGFSWYGMIRSTQRRRSGRSAM